MILIMDLKIVYFVITNKIFNFIFEFGVLNVIIVILFLILYERCFE